LTTPSAAVVPEYIAIMAALFGLLAGLVIRSRPRAVRAARTIASLTPGWAEVRGLARAGARRGEIKCAPISGRSGLGWRVVVEQELGIGWVMVVEDSEFGDFELEDHSGSIRVRAADSPITLEVAELRGRGGPFSPPPASVERLIVGATDPQGVLFHKGFRWREWVLEDGREIIVRGRVVSEPGEHSLGYRRLSDELVLAGGVESPLVVVE
jgi:hypothetical protein